MIKEGNGTEIIRMFLQAGSRGGARPGELLGILGGQPVGWKRFLTFFRSIGAACFITAGGAIGNRSYKTSANTSPCKF